MSQREESDRLNTHSHRLVSVLMYLMIFVVALRRKYDLVSPFSTGLSWAMLALFTLLYASQPLVTRRLKAYPRIYFAIQAIIIQFIGIFQSYQDTWAILYIVLGFQVARCFSRKEAIAWYGLFSASLLVTLMIEFGAISGPGRAMAYVVIGVLLISFDIQYSQHEDALAESQMLVSELKEASQKLADYTAQAEKLAAMQERNRMTQELHDSVGQKIFAIQLAAEATRLMLETDPQRAAAQIDDLQEQTQAALGQMRQLISEWRPG